MEKITFFIDDKPYEASSQAKILRAADDAGIYIPRLCSHPDLPTAHGMRGVEKTWRGTQAIEKNGDGEYEGCGLCVVEIDGKDELVKACSTDVHSGIRVLTNSDRIKEGRRKSLSSILATHPHACLTCAQKEGCSREPCSLNVSVAERCCVKLGRCEIEKLADYIGIDEATARFVHTGIPVITSDPLFWRDYNLCVGCGRCVTVCEDVRGIGALSTVVTSGKLAVGALTAGLLEANCKFCGACVEVCPTGTLLDKEIPFPPRRAELVPCVKACPVKMNVPAYVHLISEGKVDEALEVIMESAPFPLTLGYACFHPCEDDCRRKALNDPIAICALKRFAAETSSSAKNFIRSKLGAQETGKRVAIVGSGPSGLTAAYFLRTLGHQVAIFEAKEEPGGMLTFAIPEYRLPVEAAQKEIGEVLDAGIELRLGARVGVDIHLQEIRREGYDAILLAIGNQKGKKLSIEGAGLTHIVQGLDFLESAKRGTGYFFANVLYASAVRLGMPQKSSLSPFSGKGVVVIGGGNVAVDAARTALRLGGRVTIACLEKRTEMPCHAWEIESAIEEGAELLTSLGPTRFLGKTEVEGVVFAECVSVFDENGRFNPVLDSSRKHEVPADVVIVAIGLTPELSLLNGLQIPGNGRAIPVREDKFAVYEDWLFACGDVVNGPTSIVEAIASGKRAAELLNKALGGKHELREEKLFQCEGWLGKEEGFGKRSRVRIEQSLGRERIRSFEVCEKQLAPLNALGEASRCLRCDLRLELSTVPYPPEKWLDFTPAFVSLVPEGAGVYELLDGDKKAVLISGTPNLRGTLQKELGRSDVRYFTYEEDEMYTKRESELIQKFVQRYGALPEANTL